MDLFIVHLSWIYWIYLQFLVHLKPSEQDPTPSKPGHGAAARGRDRSPQKGFGRATAAHGGGVPGWVLPRKRGGFWRTKWEDMTRMGIDLDRTHELKVISEDPWKFGICWRKTEVWAAKQGLNLVLPTELGDVLHLVKKMVGFMGFMGT